MIKAIVFDFDGVIHDSINFHREKMGEFGGVELSRKEVEDMHNGNFFSSLPDKLKHVDWPAYADFIYEGQSNLKIEDAMKEALLKLGKHYQLFIISSSRTKNITDYLKNNGVTGVFQEVLGMDAHKSKVEKFNFIFEKYNLDTTTAIFITDTLGDILEANRVGVKTIAVDFGYHDKKTLSQGKPFKIVSDLRGLAQAIADFSSP